MEFDVGGFARCIDEAEGVNAEAFHHAEGAGDGAVGHDPHQHVGGFGSEGDEVPEGVVRGGRLGEAAIGLLLGGVDEVGEFDGVLDEEDGDVVADQVPVAVLGVELDGEAADVAGEISGAAFPATVEKRVKSGSSRRRAGRCPALQMSERESVTSK